MSWGHYSIFQQVGSTFLLSNDPKGPTKVEKLVSFDGFEKKATIWLKSVHSVVVVILLLWFFYRMMIAEKKPKGEREKVHSKTLLQLDSVLPFFACGLLARFTMCESRQ